MKKTILVVLLVTLTIFAFGCRQKGDTEKDTKTEQTQETNSQTPKTVTMKKSPEQGDTIATLKTNKGDIKIVLFTEETPETTTNFTELAKEGKYDGVIFHRVIEDFMVQGGDVDHKDGFGGHGYKGPGTTIKDEFVDGLVHDRGALSMANTGAPNSGGSQFFIVHPEDGTHFLDGRHTVFGFVYEGMDVVDSIAAVETDPQDKPLDDIVIETVEISTQE